jgi:hypothetical protein
MLPLFGADKKTAGGTVVVGAHAAERHIVYTTLTGYFLQDDPRTDAGSFDYVCGFSVFFLHFWFLSIVCHIISCAVWIIRELRGLVGGMGWDILYF